MPGWAELGGDPRNLFLIRAANAAEALSAAHDILGCPQAGVLLLEMSGNPAALDMVAGRKLNFAAGESGVTPILLREGADALPSAAQTRWAKRPRLPGVPAPTMKIGACPLSAQNWCATGKAPPAHGP